MPRLYRGENPRLTLRPPVFSRCGACAGHGSLAAEQAVVVGLMTDNLASGCEYRNPSILDAGTRASVSSVQDYPLGAERVPKALNIH